MWAEREPVACRRLRLVARELSKRGHAVMHFLAGGGLEA
jgi:hypothetical protein